MTKKNLFRFNKKKLRKESLNTTNQPNKDSWFKFNFNRKRMIFRSLFLFILVLSIGFGGFLFASYLGKDANIHLYTDLNLDGYDEISLITERNDYEYKLSLDLDEKESTFRIPKTSEIKEFELRRDLVISEDYSKSLLSDYTHNITFQTNQSASNLEYIEGIPYNNYDESNYSVPTNHFQGVNTFFYDEIGEEPSNFDVVYGNVYVQDEYEEHSDVLVLEKYSKIRQSFIELQNGTFETWVIPRPYQDIEIRFYEDNDCIFKIRTFGTSNEIYYYNGFKWTESGKLNNLNKLSPSHWTNLRLDFRSDGAIDYLGISEGHYDIYAGGLHVFDDLSFLKYSEHINKFNIYSLGCKREVYLDSISFTGQDKDITNDSYNIGDKDLRFYAIEKEYHRSFKFEDVNYQYLKNASAQMIFRTNITLESEKDSGLKIFNFLTDEWEFIEIFSSNKTLFIDLTDVSFFNDTATNETDVHFILFLSNFRYDYSAYLSLNCSGYFWKEISHSSSSKTYTFEGELSIDITNTHEYREREIIITSTINLSYYFCFGSWILTNTTLIKHEILIREEIYRIDFDDDVSLSDDTYYGWRTVDIEIKEIDLSKKEIKTYVEVGEIEV